MRDQRGEMTNRVVAARVNQRDGRTRLQALVPFELSWSAEQDELRACAAIQSSDQLEVALFPPLFQGPSSPRAGIEPDDRAVRVHAQPGEVGSACSPLDIGEGEHVRVLPPAEAQDRR